ncbi:MAG: hypothetical protein K6C68_01805 [Ruminococcus sp.]|nr:hypothetical protein [Ruminococcus sp.]
MADVMENKIENEEIGINDLEDVSGGYAERALVYTTKSLSFFRRRSSKDSTSNWRSSCGGR